MKISMKMRLLLAFVALSSLHLSAQQRDDLQEFINRESAWSRPFLQTRATEPVVVDLSTFTATKREQTLELGNGGSYRFINGTLDRAETLNGPVIRISNGSTAEIGKDAIVTGNSHMAVDNAVEVIRMEGGTLNITQGIVEGAVGYREYSTPNMYIGNPLQDPAVRMTSPQDRFYMNGGTMYGILDCDVSGALIQLNQGQLMGMGLRAGTESPSRGSGARKVSPVGTREPWINTHSNVCLVETTSKNYQWGYIQIEPIVLSGEEPASETPAEAFDPYAITLYGQSTLYLNKSYTPGFLFSLYDKKEGDVIVVGDDYTITPEDVAKMKIKGVYFTAGPPYLDDRQSYLELKDNKVYLTFKHAIDNVDDLQAKIDEIAAKGISSLQSPDTIEIAQDGVLIDKVLQVRTNCHVVLTGGCLRISPTINESYSVNIDSNASLMLDNIRVDLMENDFSLNSYIFNVLGTLTIGKSGGKEVTFDNVPYSKGAKGECLFYVYKYATLNWNTGTLSYHRPQVSVVKAQSTGIVNISGGDMTSFSVPTIDGDGDVTMYGGKVAGWSEKEGIIVANQFCFSGEDGTIQDEQGLSIYLKVRKATIEGSLTFLGKYNKIMVDNLLYMSGNISIPNLSSIFINQPESFQGLFLFSKLTAEEGWNIDAADWNQLPLNKAFVQGAGYQLTQADFEQMKFLNLPETLEPYFDEGDYSVKLRQKLQGDDLQEFVDKQTGDVVMVNLSQFNSVTRSKALEVKTGRKYLFYGGTLTRGTDSAEPLMIISNGSSVEIGSINHDWEKRAWLTVGSTTGDVEAVRLEGGTLRVTEGVVAGGPVSDLDGSDNKGTAVLMTSDDDVFELASPESYYGAWVSGPIVCLAPKASVSIRGGYMHTGNADFGVVRSYADVTYEGNTWLHVVLLGKTNVVKLTSPLAWPLELTAMEKGYGDVIVEGTDFQLDTDPNIKNFKYVEFKGNKDYKLRLAKNQVVLGIDDLQDFINNPGNGNGVGTEEDPIKADVDCEGIDVNDDLKFKDDLQYFISGEQPGESDCQGTIRQNEGDVIVPQGTTVTYTHLYLHGCGCQKYVYVYGTVILDYNIYIYNYLRYIYLRPGGRVVIRGLNGEVKEEIFYIEGGVVEYRGGESSGGTYGWYNVGGTFSIYDGIIRGGICGGWTGAQGVSYIYGGTVHGGAYNYGSTYIYGGTIAGSIWNYGQLYVSGGSTVNISDVIYAMSGCRIYIVSKLTYVLRLHFTVENIVCDTPIIVGGEGYTLTAEDCEKIQITLPEGYSWRFDPDSGGIVITSVSGVAGVSRSQASVVKSYNAAGRQVGEDSKGLTIQRMSDGSVKKVNQKK